MNKHQYKHDIILAILLFGLWLLLSGHYDFFHVAMGFLSSVLVVFIHHRLFSHRFFSDQFSPYPMRSHFFFLVYIPWLFYQIVLAAVTVAKAILSSKQRIDPALIKFTTTLPNNVSKVILANSITLTPGTITVFLEDDEFLVHGLMEASYSSLVDGSFQSMIARNYHAQPGQVLSSVSVVKSAKDL